MAAVKTVVYEGGSSILSGKNMLGWNMGRGERDLDIRYNKQYNYII